MRCEKITTSVKKEREEMNQSAALDKLRADIDYLYMMEEVEPEEEESEAHYEQEI